MKTLRQFLKEEKDCCAELASALEKNKVTSYDGIDTIMQRIAKEHDMTPKALHNAWMKRYNKTPDDWIKDKLNE
jgi:ABC-type proline/glycine betaine transport system substrate-binding protein